MGTLQHRREITNLLQEHPDGLTLGEIATHFDPPGRGGGRTGAYATIRLRETVKAALDMLQQEDKVVFEDGVYKLNLGLGST